MAGWSSWSAERSAGFTRPEPGRLDCSVGVPPASVDSSSAVPGEPGAPIRYSGFLSRIAWRRLPSASHCTWKSVFG